MLLRHPILEIAEGVLRSIRFDRGAFTSNCERIDGEVWTGPLKLFHAHLESFSAPSAQFRRTPFTDWIIDLQAWEKGNLQDATPGLDALARAGAGEVHCHVHLETLQSLGPDGLRLLMESPCRPMFYLELLGASPECASELFQTWQKWAPFLYGVALHAPYSVSMELAQAVFRECARSQTPLSIHLGEHTAEREFLKYQSGPMAEFLRGKGLPLPERTWDSPVAWLAEALQGENTPLWVVHGGDLSVQECQEVEKLGGNLVWCPGTHRYFSRSKPKFAEASLGAPYLGCDSMASNTMLSPLHEFRVACEEMPEYAPSDWWNALAPQKVQVGNTASFGRLGFSDASTIPTTAEELLDELRKDRKIQALETLSF